MRYPVAVTASVLSIALYFAATWGFDGLRIFTSPNYGLEDAWRSQVVYWIARWLGLGPQALLQMAAIVGAVKLAVAGVFTVHLFDRIRTFRLREPNNDVLELGLILVVAMSIVMVAPAIWQHDPVLIRTTTLNLILASVAAALCALERAESETSVVTTRLAAVQAETARERGAGVVFGKKPRVEMLAPVAEMLAPVEEVASAPANPLRTPAAWFARWRKA